MSQFITIQVGQCGNQIGSAFWPLVLHEYGIPTNSSGINHLKTHKGFLKTKREELSDGFHSFFYMPDDGRTEFSFNSVADLEKAKVKARAVLIDMEDSVVARYRHGPLSKLFDETCTVTNYPGSGNNWAVGYHAHGSAYYSQIEEVIRRTVEGCDCLHGFLLTHSLGGGTGSGLGTATLKLLDDIYPHVDRFVSCVYPASTQDVVTAPYNVLLATKKLIEYATCVFPVENRALQDICGIFANGKKRNADQLKYNASCPPFQDMNSIVVNKLLHLTSGSRFPGDLNTDMNELATNLVPFPRMQYIFSSVSPVAFTAPEILNNSHGTKYQDELFTNAWSRDHQLLKIDPLSVESVITGAAHIYRGDISLNGLRRNIERFQKKANFTSWSSESMKTGLCSVPPPGHVASLMCMLNSTAMSSLFKDVIHQFDKLFKKKAHIHHYSQIDGFETEDFVKGREKIIEVYKYYSKIKKSDHSTVISRLRLK